VQGGAPFASTIALEVPHDLRVAQIWRHGVVSDVFASEPWRARGADRTRRPAALASGDHLGHSARWRCSCGANASTSSACTT
jgi:hypothetical protein